MSHVRVCANSVKAVDKPSTLLLLCPEEQTDWCEQFTQEGYNVVHIRYPPESTESFMKSLKSAETRILGFGTNWGLVTYGLQSRHAGAMIGRLALPIADLKAAVHFCPDSTNTHGFLAKDNAGRYLPVTFHLASTQEELHALLLPLEDPAYLDYKMPTHSPPPVTVYSYPRVSASPPFPFMTKAPAGLKAGDKLSVDPYVRSATSLSLTRTLELMKRHLGPWFNLEKLWDLHTYYEFVERDAPKTMSTMVAVPYVNHVPNMTGGTGYEDLARFYKYHFTTVTPPHSEIITVSRTVGVDRIVDEMIFKFDHTTEVDYFLPGIPPTGKHVEIAMVGVVAFRGDKLFFEHLYWDQASLLVQIGLLDPTNIPVAGIEIVRKVLDPFGQPSNTLLSKWKESEGLSID